jgi:hypothetical protein
VIGNWDAAGSYSRKCWEAIARQFIPDDRQDAFAQPWEGPPGYRPDTEDHTAFLPIPLTAPGSATSEKELFRDSFFAYLNKQNVTSLVLVCDSPYARRTLDILGPLSTRPIFVIVASHEELLSSQMSALADDHVFRLCPNNRQQADLVLMATRLQKLRTLHFWTAEKEDTDEYLYHAKDLYESLTKRSHGDIAFLKWNAIAPPVNAALFVAGYSATVAELGRISEPLAKARLVMFSDGCTPVMGLKERVSRIRSTDDDHDTFAIRSKVEPDRIATETVSFLRTNGDLAPRVLAAKVKDKRLSLLGTIPVSFQGTDNSAIPFESTEL